MASPSPASGPELVLDYSKLLTWDSLSGEEYPTDLRPALPICAYNDKNWGDGAMLTSMNGPSPSFKGWENYAEVTTDLVAKVGPAPLQGVDYLRNGWQPCWVDVEEEDNDIKLLKVESLYIVQRASYVTSEPAKVFSFSAKQGYARGAKDDQGKNAKERGSLDELLLDKVKYQYGRSKDSPTELRRKFDQDMLPGNWFNPVHGGGVTAKAKEVGETKDLLTTLLPLAGRLGANTNMNRLEVIAALPTCMRNFIELDGTTTEGGNVLEITEMISLQRITEMGLLAKYSAALRDAKRRMPNFWIAQDDLITALVVEHSKVLAPEARHQGPEPRTAACDMSEQKRKEILMNELMDMDEAYDGFAAYMKDHRQEAPEKEMFVKRKFSPELLKCFMEYLSPEKDFTKEIKVDIGFFNFLGLNFAGAVGWRHCTKEEKERLQNEYNTNSLKRWSAETKARVKKMTTDELEIELKPFSSMRAFINNENNPISLGPNWERHDTLTIGHFLKEMVESFAVYPNADWITMEGLSRHRIPAALLFYFLALPEYLSKTTGRTIHGCEQGGPFGDLKFGSDAGESLKRARSSMGGYSSKCAKSDGLGIGQE